MGYVLAGLAWIWVVLGMMMWIDITFIYGVRPSTWTGNYSTREIGWASAIFFYLPVCLLFGVFFWITLGWLTLTRR